MLYETDLYAWTKTQSDLLRKREFEKIDIDNIIEEIETLGRSEKRTLSSHLSNLILHLLKIEFQPEKHTRSWDLSVQSARIHAKRVYSENPSMKQHLNEILKDSYGSARWRACDETGLGINVFPERCPWSIEELFCEKE